MNEEEFARQNVFGLGQENTAVSLTPGMVITIPPEVKHWHGAKKGSWFAHIALEVPGMETSNEWLESVSDEVYAQLG